ncbi:hypothetical protein [Tropicibacter sp. S64]|uniref:hypothetical protein n=1 Tax=Tropicibacter sp. S64 TaxID=3415122 RepID=UPI003C7C1D05
MIGKGGLNVVDPGLPGDGTRKAERTDAQERHLSQRTPLDPLRCGATRARMNGAFGTGANGKRRFSRSVKGPTSAQGSPRPA